MKNKTLADFADFIKQIEFDDYGAMSNIEYYDNTCWHKMQDMSIITYVNFTTDKIRIKPKPKMRPMTAHEIYLYDIPCRVTLNREKYILVQVDNGYVYLYDGWGNKVVTMDLSQFVNNATRPDGSKFEVEDV